MRTHWYRLTRPQCVKLILSGFIRNTDNGPVAVCTTTTVLTQCGYLATSCPFTVKARCFRHKSTAAGVFTPGVEFIGEKVVMAVELRQRRPLRALHSIAVDQLPTTRSHVVIAPDFIMRTITFDGDVVGAVIIVESGSIDAVNGG